MLYFKKHLAASWPQVSTVEHSRRFPLIAPASVAPDCGSPCRKQRHILLLQPRKSRDKYFPLFWRGRSYGAQESNGISFLGEGKCRAIQHKWSSIFTDKSRHGGACVSREKSIKKSFSFPFKIGFISKSQLTLFLTNVLFLTALLSWNTLQAASNNERYSRQQQLPRRQNLRGDRHTPQRNED